MGDIGEVEHAVGVVIEVMRNTVAVAGAGVSGDVEEGIDVGMTLKDL